MSLGNIYVRIAPSGPTNPIALPDIPANYIQEPMFGDEVVSPRVLQSGAVTPGKEGSGFAQSADYPKTTAGVQTLLAPTTHDRVVIIAAKTTENFANGTGAQTLFKIGETGEDEKFCPTASFEDGSADPECQTFAGILLAGKSLIVTATAAVGDGTGAIQVNVIALRK